MRPRVVIVGTGQAGFQTASSLRSGGFDGSICMVGEEAHLPYQRPPLSKGFLTGHQRAHQVTLRPAAFYSEHDIELLPGEKAIEIDQSSRVVRLRSGSRVPYDKLILALGARIRKLPVPGADLDGVCYLRTFDDAIAIKARLEGASEIVVIGGGFIGLEVAAVAGPMGKSVTIVELQERLMARCVSPDISDFYAKLHTRWGAQVLFGTGVAEIAGASRVREIVLADGTRKPAALVIAGIGVLPNTDLARGAGLGVANGIVVDEYLRTEDSDIYAIGDCAEHPNRFAGTRIRLESVQNAVDQGTCVAASIAGGGLNSYQDVPWFWTDQHDIKLQMAGLSQGYDRAICRGNSEDRKFSMFYFREQRLIAVDSINRPADHLVGRRLLAQRTPLTPEQAADESVDLKALSRADRA